LFLSFTIPYTNFQKVILNLEGCLRLGRSGIGRDEARTSFNDVCEGKYRAGQLKRQPSYTVAFWPKVLFAAPSHFKDAKRF
jgi:hypothetical protein